MNGKFLNLYFRILKIELFINLIIYSLSTECPKETPIIKNDNCTSIFCSESQFNSGECKINNSIIKTQWLTNIIKFENTSGDINLINNNNYEKIIFSTTLSNKEERIIFTLDFNEKEIFRNENNNFVSYISKNIKLSQNKEILNGQCIINKYDNEYLFLIGKENSDMQILNLYEYTEDFDYISKSEYLKGNKKIKGDYSYCRFNEMYIYKFFVGAITSKEDESSNYNISLYCHELSIEDNKLKTTYKYKIEIDDVKGEYASYFVDENNNYFSCFYLNKLNIYNITVFGIEENYFVKGDSLNLGSPSGPNNDEIYFFKGFSLCPGEAVYAYYIGVNNEIPTFLFKKIDNIQFSDQPITNITLTEYSFNNNIEFNDLFKKSTKEFYFVSTSKNKEMLIIANFKSKLWERIVAIMYYTVELKKYYNMKILQGIKGTPFNEYFLSLSFNYFYCLNESCENPDEENKNSALIIFSYVNKSNVEIDFINYMLTKNKKYIIIDLAENITIENNIFGFQIEAINRGYWEYYFYDSGIEFTFLDNENSSYDANYFVYSFYPNNAKINISFENYDFEENYFGYIDLDLSAVLIPPDKNESIKYTDKVNNNYGDPESFDIPSFLYSNSFHYYININMPLISKCNDTNCNLCFSNDTNYCILCKSGYNTIFDNNYGKKKICVNDTIAEELTHLTEELTVPTTNIENIITTEITTIPVTTIITTYITTIPETTYFANITTTEIVTSQVTTIITTTELTTIPVTTIMTTEFITIPITTIIISEIASFSISSILTTELTTIPETIYIENSITKEITSNPVKTNIDNQLSLFDRYINGEYQNDTLSDNEIKALYKEVKNYLISYYIKMKIKIYFFIYSFK